ncbi:MAG: lipocalin-like domain-containing protein [Candidatus Aminicenantes bacterium]|nr:lipocalin-like domain-containing protein [Candidatus Aminicenantes bacterium]
MNSEVRSDLGDRLLSFDGFQGNLGLEGGVVRLSHPLEHTIPPVEIWQASKIHLNPLPSFWGAFQFCQEGNWKLAYVHLSSANPLVGVWKIIETAIIDANGESKNSCEHPGLYIFQDDYYCMAPIQGDEPRMEFENPWNPTKEETIEAYMSFLANAGTYDLKDSIMTTYPTIARVPNFVGGSASYE